jgi:O-acetylhomoserine/O-acetylserine sulfhydrylase-like pyridoxal-dependent enzyme
MGKIDTLAVHAGEEPRFGGSAVTPIFQSATFVFTGEENDYGSVRYTRCNNNPSQETLAGKVAKLEGISFKICYFDAYYPSFSRGRGGKVYNGLCFAPIVLSFLQ